jgi:sugar phosphate permease
MSLVKAEKSFTIRRAFAHDPGFAIGTGSVDMNSTTPRQAGQHWLRSYHGVIALAGCVILLISNGMALSGLSPFRPAFSAQYGWTMKQMTLGDLISFVIVGLLAPFLGIVMDRVGVRWLMLIGGFVLAAAYHFYGTATSLNGIYGAHVLLGVGIALAGLVPVARLIGRWFELARGTAMGIALAGSSLASFVFPPLALVFVQSHGIAGAFDRLALAGLVLSLIVFIFVRDQPEAKGLTAFGQSSTRKSETELTGVDYGTALRSLSFWCLALGASFTFFSMLGTLANLFQHMLNLQFEPKIALDGLKVMLFAALVGKFGFGFISDFLKPKTVYIANLAVMALGAMLMAQSTHASVWLALTVFGIGWGGLYTMLQLLAVDSFGMKSAGKIMGTIATFDAIGGGLGSYVMGSIGTKNGSYQQGFLLMFALICAGLLAATQIRKLAYQK